MSTYVHQMTIIQVLLTCLAVHRVTILVTKDTITEPIRKKIDDKYVGKLVDFMYCPWCVSVWVAGGAVPLTVWCWAWWGWVCLGLAASSVTGVLAEMV